MGEKTVSSENGVEKIGYPYAKNEVGPLSYIMKKINSKWNKDLKLKS